MPTLQTDESNILDAETINWRLIVIPVLVALIVLAGGVGYYYYQITQRQQAEDTAHAAFVAAKTPADYVKVADQHPGTDQAILALLAAADGSYAKHDYATAVQDYQRILGTAGVNQDLLNSAQIGLGSALQANGKIDDAINAYMTAAQMGDKNPYAPYAYWTVAKIYETQGNKDKQREVLTEASSLDSSSSFVKQAQEQLKQLNAAMAPPITVPVGTPNPGASATPTVTVTPLPSSQAPSAPGAPTIQVKPAVPAPAPNAPAPANH